MVKVVGMIHSGLRVDPSDQTIEAVREFYGDILGLEADPSRPQIPGVPGFWFNVGPNQIHIMGARDASPIALEPGKDPTLPHVALVVDDLEAAKAEFARRGIEHWVIGNVVGRQQLFARDPSGNMLEFQQAS
jgi:catechol 2,3-dioxygenase-like lactoylglutathione lyase family enzyme